MDLTAISENAIFKYRLPSLQPDLFRCFLLELSAPGTSRQYDKNFFTSANRSIPSISSKIVKADILPIPGIYSNLWTSSYGTN